MFGLYTNKDVQKLVRRLREEYDAIVERQRETVEELKQQNRFLLARVSELETERGSVSDAIVHAVAEGERIKRESAKETENERKELSLLAGKCRAISQQTGESPDPEDAKAYAEFLQKLHGALGEEQEEEQEEAFNMDEVLSPKEPLNLQQLCMDLGLMEEDNE